MATIRSKIIINVVVILLTVVATACQTIQTLVPKVQDVESNEA